MIPAGMTAYLQLMDVAANGQFKLYLRAKINEFIELRMTRNARGNFIKPSIDEVGDWIRYAWEKIDSNMISNGLSLWTVTGPIPSQIQHVALCGATVLTKRRFATLGKVKHKGSSVFALFSRENFKE